MKRRRTVLENEGKAKAPSPRVFYSIPCPIDFLRDMKAVLLSDLHKILIPALSALVLEYYSLDHFAVALKGVTTGFALEWINLEGESQNWIRTPTVQCSKVNIAYDLSSFLATARSVLWNRAGGWRWDELRFAPNSCLPHALTPIPFCNLQEMRQSLQSLQHLPLDGAGLAEYSRHLYDATRCVDLGDSRTVTVPLTLTSALVLGEEACNSPCLEPFLSFQARLVDLSTLSFQPVDIPLLMPWSDAERIVVLVANNLCYVGVQGCAILPLGALLEERELGASSKREKPRWRISRGDWTRRRAVRLVSCLPILERSELWLVWTSEETPSLHNQTVIHLETGRTWGLPSRERDRGMYVIMRGIAVAECSSADDPAALA